MHRKSRRGLTFVEILIVTIIVGILGLVAFVGWQQSLKKTAQREGEMYLKSTADQLTSYLQTRNTFGSYAQFSAYAALNNNLKYYLPLNNSDFSINVGATGQLNLGSTIRLRSRNVNQAANMVATWTNTPTGRQWVITST